MGPLPLAFQVALSSVAAAYFPSLPRPALRPFDGGGEAYFESQPRPAGRCVVYADPRAEGLPEDALRAILAHELEHCASYRAMSRLQLLRAGLEYLLRPQGAWVTAYERSMDEGVLRLGLGSGLKAYRLWLYPRLTPAQRAIKRRQYLTPAEIDAYLSWPRALSKAASLSSGMP